MIAFKEWSCVCEALAEGIQTLLIRKGGIHEGREGFAFAHERFHLFPTRFHATADQLKPGVIAGAQPEWQVGDRITLTHWCDVEWARTYTDWEEIMSFHAEHIYSENTVRERFDWQGKGMASGSLHIAKVCVHKHLAPIEFSYAKSHGGCRSWVEI